MRKLTAHGLRVGHCMHPEVMSIRDGSWKAVAFPALVHLLIHPAEGPVLFDTGYDPAFLQATARFPERLYRWATPMALSPADTAACQIARFGFEPDDIRHVVLSHFHADHVAGLHAFPKARIHCARAGLDAACSGARWTQVRQGFLKGLLPPGIMARASFFEDMRRVSLGRDMLPFEDGADILGDGSLLAVELPGHCPGHWGVLLDDEARGRHFLVADAAWSSDAIRRNMPAPSLSTGLLGDTAQTRATLARLHDLHLRNPEIALTPSHCRECAARISEAE